VKLTFIISIFLFSNILFSLDEGTVGVEYSIGQVLLYHSEIDNQESEDFVHLSHTYLKYYGTFFFSFKSQLGVSKYLLFQNSDTSVGLSYKNIITGVIPGIKYKYLDGFSGFIPEASLGLTFDVISLWGNSESSLIFFSGINLSTGFAYEFSMGLTVGLKFMYDFGYGNYMNEQKSRFNISIMTFMLTFDFYDE